MSSTSSKKSPLAQTFNIPFPAYAQAAEGTTPGFKCLFDGVIESVSVIPAAALTGADTNTRRHALINKGQAGAGTAVSAELQYNSGVNLVAFDEKALTLSTTDADEDGIADALKVVAGDVLAFFSDAVASGLADGGGVCVVKIKRS